MKRKDKGWTRQQYEHCFRLMRRYGDDVIGLAMMGIPNEIVNAADYSYQAAYDGEAGWISSSRRKRFYAILFRVYTTGEEIPF